MRILITGGKSAIALKLLKAFDQHEVILSDYGEVPLISSAAYQLITLGEKNEDTLAHTLLNNCLDHHIDTILPLHGFEVESVAKAEVLFKEFSINTLLPAMSIFENYLNSEVNGGRNWVIYSNGAVFYCTQNHDSIVAYGKINNLSGAFYFEINDTLKLTLITV